MLLRLSGSRSSCYFSVYRHGRHCGVGCCGRKELRRTCVCLSVSGSAKRGIPRHYYSRQSFIHKQQVWAMCLACGGLCRVPRNSQPADLSHWLLVPVARTCFTIPLAGQLDVQPPLPLYCCCTVAASSALLDLHRLAWQQATALHSNTASLPVTQHLPVKLSTHSFESPLPVLLLHIDSRVLRIPSAAPSTSRLSHNPRAPFPPSAVSCLEALNRTIESG